MNYLSSRENENITYKNNEIHTTQWVFVYQNEKSFFSHRYNMEMRVEHLRNYLNHIV